MTTVTPSDTEAQCEPVSAKHLEADSELDTSPATLLNTQVNDWGARVTSLLNWLIVVSGGFLSITIGAFISAQPPRFDEHGLSLVRGGWYLLSAALVCSLLTAFLHTALQAHVIKRMKALFRAEGSPRIEIVEGAFWQVAAIWVVFVAAFVCCTAGIATLSIGAAQLLHARPGF